MSITTYLQKFSTPKFSWVIDLFLLALGIGTFFFIFLGNHSLGVPDEARYAEIPREMIALRDYLIPHLNGILYFEKPPLFYWLQVGAIKLFGLSEWAVRLPNAFMALLGCLLIYSSARLLFDRRTGILATLILASNLLYFGMAHIITLDMTFTVLMSASLLSFLIGVTVSAHRVFSYSAYIFAALAVMAKGLIGILFPLLIIGVWIALLNQWRLLKNIYLFTGSILFFAITIPWHLLMELKHPGFLQFYFIDQHVLRYFTTEAGRYKPDWFFIPILLLGFLPWTVFLFQAIIHSIPRHWITRSQSKIELFLLSWIILIFIFFSLSHSKLITYLLPVFPPLSILLGRYFSKHWYDAEKIAGIKIGYDAGAITIALLMAIVFLFAQQENVLFNLHAAVNAIGYATIIWTIGACSSAWLFNIKNTIAAFVVLLVSTSVTFGCLMNGLNIIDLGSIKPLLSNLPLPLKTDTPIISYDRYYQDLPYYLQRRVIVVNWRGELDYGMQHQNTQDWMINDQKFLDIWRSQKQAYLFTDIDTYRTLINAYPDQFHLIDTHDQNVLATNKRPRL